jgi:hypothetical protein
LNETETATFGYLRERLFLKTAALQQEPLPIRDVRRVINRERQFVLLTAVFVPWRHSDGSKTVGAEPTPKARG